MPAAIHFPWCETGFRKNSGLLFFAVLMYTGDARFHCRCHAKMLPVIATLLLQSMPLTTQFKMITFSMQHGVAMIDGHNDAKRKMTQMNV
jgi:hypothetical protein